MVHFLTILEYGMVEKTMMMPIKLSPKIKIENRNSYLLFCKFFNLKQITNN